ncbi:hypothetical protein JYK04_00762 [Streptomyces nojiriensis]|nr:hypothetical protein JYK04_00762 [Streptomyces nojiriensis]
MKVWGKRAVTAGAMAMAVMGVVSGTANAAGSLPCGSGYSCDGYDPNTVSWDSGPDTDSSQSVTGTATVHLRSGKKNGQWYAWAKGTTQAKAGIWIDRSTDGGRTWDGMRGYIHLEGGEGNYTAMSYWPDGTHIRACINVEGVALKCTGWVS